MVGAARLIVVAQPALVNVKALNNAAKQTFLIDVMLALCMVLSKNENS